MMRCCQGARDIHAYGDVSAVCVTSDKVFVEEPRLYVGTFYLGSRQYLMLGCTCYQLEKQKTSLICNINYDEIVW